MKFLAIFMMSLVAGLSLVPCCIPMTSTIRQSIADNSSDCCKEESCNKKNNESTHSGNEDKGCSSCSPFFACGTCVGFTFQSGISGLSHLNSPSKISYWSFDMQIDSEYFDTKWQPPKIS